MRVSGLRVILNGFTDAIALVAGEWFEQCMSALRTAVDRHLRDGHIARPLIPLGDVDTQGLDDRAYATSLSNECLCLVQCSDASPRRRHCGAIHRKSTNRRLNFVRPVTPPNATVCVSLLPSQRSGKRRCAPRGDVQISARACLARGSGPCRRNIPGRRIPGQSPFGG